MKAIIKKFVEGLFTKAQFITGTTITLLVSSAIVWAFTHTSLHEFYPNTTISASDMNDNFEYVKERLDALGGEQFELKTTSAQSLPHGSTNNQVADLTSITFGTVSVDLSTLGALYQSQGYHVVTESGFYQYNMVGNIQAGTANYGSLVLAQKVPGSSTFTKQNYLSFYNTTNLNKKGTQATSFYNSGTSIMIMGGANYWANGASNMTIDAGVTFSFKKL